MQAFFFLLSSAHFKRVACPNMEEPAVETKLVVLAVVSPEEQWWEEVGLFFVNFLQPIPFLWENNGLPSIQPWSSWEYIP